jgi:glycosyltransferase involved in cell wall biosynthesis
LKFLLLNQTFYPDVASSAQHLADLAVGLTERGHAVTVITSRRAYDDPKTMFERREVWRSIRIHRIASLGFGKGAKWRRIADCASFAALSFLQTLMAGRHDVVVALTSPPLISLLGLLIARLRRSRFVYWVMDLNPDEAIAAGWLSADSVAGKILECLSRLSLRSADDVIALDRFMFERIEGKGVSAKQISIIPPWTHDGFIEFDAQGRERFRRQHGLEGKFVVMYSGNHSSCHPLDTVMDAAGRLADKREIVFCFVGGGTEFRKIQALLCSPSPKGLRTKSGSFIARNIVCLPYQPLSDLSASLSAADLHLVVMGDGLVGMVHPCKIYNVLRVGAPLMYIGPRPSPVFEIVSEIPGSGSIDHGDSQGLVRHIERMLSHRNGLPDPTPSLAAQFSKKRLLPGLIAKLECLKEY